MAARKKKKTGKKALKKVTYTETQLNTAISHAFKDGKEEGNQEGYEEGLAKGQDAGRNAGWYTAKLHTFSQVAHEAIKVNKPFMVDVEMARVIVDLVDNELPKKDKLPRRPSDFKLAT